MARMIRYGKNDEETVRLTAKALGLPKSEVWRMLSIVRGESDGDIVKVKPRRHTARTRALEEKKPATPLDLFKERGKRRATKSLDAARMGVYSIRRTGGSRKNGHSNGHHID